MTSINGAKHDVEDILASIRTSIADRSPLSAARSEHRIQALRTSANIADELPDFELPAIFKPAPPQAEKPNLLGRLSEALSTNSEASADRSRTVIRFEPAHGRMNEQSAAAAQAAKAAEKAAAERAAAEKAAAQRGSTGNEDVKRVMTSFFDTRINRMGELTRVATESAPASPPVRQAQLNQPPQLPIGSQFFESGAMEDAAAQLLRPILKQWLTDNMPKIVEKALRSETGDDRSSPFPRR